MRHAESDLSLEQSGRHARPYTGNWDSLHRYQRLPENAWPNQAAMVPPEPPLNVDVNYVEPQGEAFEVAVATMLAKEVLPALDELREQQRELREYISSMVRWRLDEAALALDMGVTVFERLRDLGMLSKPFADQWRSLQQRRKKLIEREWPNKCESEE
jgi:hypothetical protein